MLSLPRRRSRGNGKHDHVVDYRHVIHTLRRKPMALLNLIYRSQLFPRQADTWAFQALLVASDERRPCATTVELLSLAHERGCEAALAQLLEIELAAYQLPDLQDLRERFEAPTTASAPSLSISCCSASMMSLAPFAWEISDLSSRGDVSSQV